MRLGGKEIKRSRSRGRKSRAETGRSDLAYVAGYVDLTTGVFGGRKQGQPPGVIDMWGGVEGVGGTEQISVYLLLLLFFFFLFLG